MLDFYKALSQLIYEHREALGVFGYMLGTAFLVTMPPKFPRTFEDLWAWMYDGSHQFANVRNLRNLLPGGQTPGEPKL